MLITELAVFRFAKGRMKLVQLMPGVSERQVAEATEASYETDLT